MQYNNSKIWEKKGKQTKNPTNVTCDLEKFAPKAPISIIKLE